MLTLPCVLSPTDRKRAQYSLGVYEPLCSSSVANLTLDTFVNNAVRHSGRKRRKRKRHQYLHHMFFIFNPKLAIESF